MATFTDKRYLLLLPPALMSAGMVTGRLFGWLAGPAILAGLARGPQERAGALAFAANFLAPVLSNGDNLALLLGFAGLLVAMPVAARALRRSAGA